MLPPQQLGLIQSGEPHASQSEDSTGQALRLMFFSPEILMSTAAMLEQSEPPVLPNLVVSDTVTVQQFLNLHTTLSKDVSQLECETLIFAFLTQLILRCSENPPTLSELREPSIVPVIRDYLRENYAENMSLSELAKLVDRTPAHLVRVFSAEVGLPPHAYQTQLRIDRAKTLLMQGESLVDTALSRQV